MDINLKLQRYNKLNDVIKCHFGKHMSIDTKLRLHNITSKSVLLYGSKVWILNGGAMKKLGVAQMRFLRPLLGFTRLDHQRNSDIRDKLKVNNIVEDIQSYHQKWFHHLQRMNNTRFPLLAYNYQPHGRRDPGRPKQR